MDNLASALIGHMVGDFVIQNDWMATNKKQRSFPCLVHCVLWTASVMFFAEAWSPWLALWLFATHFAIDRTQFISWWMNNVSGQSGFAEHLKPWSLIAVDNTFHLITLWVGFKYLV
jgi:hypothetical protein